MNTLKDYAETIGVKARARLIKHGHHDCGLYGITKDGRELFQEFPIECGDDKNEIVQKIREWLDQKRIVKYAMIAEVYLGDGEKQFNRKEALQIIASEKSDPFYTLFGVAEITRPDDAEKVVVDDFEWDDGLVGRMANLFLPLLPPTETPDEFLHRLNCLLYNEPVERQVSQAVYLAFLKLKDIGLKKEQIQESINELFVKYDELLQKNDEELIEELQSLQPIPDPSPDVPYPLYVPGYASERCRGLIGKLIVLLEGHERAQDTDQLNDNILAMLVAAANQIAKINDRKERNGVIASANNLINKIVQNSLEMKETLAANGITNSDIANMPGTETFRMDNPVVRLN